MQNKIALVTGGSRGLGKSAALHLAKAGKDVIITYRTKEEEAKAVVAEIEAHGGKAAALHLDMSDFKSLPAFVTSLSHKLKAHFGAEGFDYLVNNAGMGATIPYAEATEEQFDDFMNVHFKGVYFLTQRCLPLLNDNGSIVNVSSGTTRFCVPGYSIYASMKGAIEVFTRYLAKDLGARGIRANVLAPGPVETDFNNAAIRSNPQMKGFMGSMTALGRVGVADDIGPVITYLCSDESRWVNGQRIEASGGINL